MTLLALASANDEEEAAFVEEVSTVLWTRVSKKAN
jgi:hypothetical protein